MFTLKHRWNEIDSWLTTHPNTSAFINGLLLGGVATAFYFRDHDALISVLLFLQMIV